MIHTDTVTTLLGAVVQHGFANNRIYVMHLNGADPGRLIPELNDLARREGYTKIFAKVEASKAARFLDAGYRKEGEVPHFFKGERDALFLGTYFDDGRKVSTQAAQIDAVIAAALSSTARTSPPFLGDLVLRRADIDDIPKMARLYREVFSSYPFPICDPGYLLETMTAHVDYYLIEDDGAVVALASSEMDLENRNAEMTDFATSADYRGRRLAGALLFEMESAMRRRNIACVYTIARALSYPMNLTFARLGYSFGGLLVNNTQISGRIESMTVWHKRLLP